MTRLLGFRRAAAAFVPGSAPLVPTSHPDTRLIALCLEAVQLHAESEAAKTGLDELERDSPAQAAAVLKASHERTARWHNLCADIAATPAKTLRGTRAKAAVLVDVIALEVPLVASLCRDMLGGMDRAKVRELLEIENPDAALLADCAAFDELEAAYRKTDFRAEPGTPEDAAAEAEQERIHALQRPIALRMFAHVAVTREGQAARARSLAGWAPDLVEKGDGDMVMVLTHAVLRDLIADGVTGHVEREAA